MLGRINEDELRQKINAIRKKRGLEYKQLAFQLRVKWESTIRNWLCGRRKFVCRIPLVKLIEMSKVLGFRLVIENGKIEVFETEESDYQI